MFPHAKNTLFPCSVNAKETHVSTIVKNTLCFHAQKIQKKDEVSTAGLYHVSNHHCKLNEMHKVSWCFYTLVETY